jgi:hypothetical protein
LHTPQTINFIPPIEVKELREKDYQAMQEFMIYGETLGFDALLLRMNGLKERINKQ